MGEEGGGRILWGEEGVLNVRHVLLDLINGVRVFIPVRRKG